MGQVISKLTLIPDVNAGSPADGQALVWDAASGKWIAGSAGVTDHGALTGLGDDDHTQYLLTDGSRSMTGNLSLYSGSYLTVQLTVDSDRGTIRLYRYSSLGAYLTGMASNASYFVGALHIGRVPVDLTGVFHVTPITSGGVGIIVAGKSSQTGDLMQLKDSNGTVLFGFGAAGEIMTNQASANTNTPAGPTAYQLAVYDTAGTLLGYIPVYASAW